MVFHPPIRHDEARRDNQGTETNLGDLLRRTDLFREAPPSGTSDTNDARLRETEELQQRWGMRDDETLGCDIEHAGRHATEALDTGVGIPRKLGHSTRREHSRA